MNSQNILLVEDDAFCQIIKYGEGSENPVTPAISHTLTACSFVFSR